MVEDTFVCSKSAYRSIEGVLGNEMINECQILVFIFINEFITHNLVSWCYLVFGDRFSHVYHIADINLLLMEIWTKICTSHRLHCDLRTRI